MPIMHSWTNDHDVAHLQAKTAPMNLIWSKSAMWLLSSSVHKIPGALIMPMVMPILPPWVNDHDIAHLQAKTIPMNLIGNESTQWLQSSNVPKIPVFFIVMPMGMPIMPPWANNHGTAHVQAKTVLKNLI